MKRVVVLGSTGSIGQQALEVCRLRGYEVVGLAAGKNLQTLSRQIALWKPRLVAAEESLHKELKARFPGLRLATAEEVAALEAEVAVAAIPGLAGLAPTRAAVRTGKRVALANKEAMVAAGPLLWREAEAHGAEILPVDSEHSALFQALLGERREDVAELILTASGGPFLREPEDLAQVTPEMALRHPRWRMGPKVTVDSATLFNKGPRSWRPRSSSASPWRGSRSSSIPRPTSTAWCASWTEASRPSSAPRTCAFSSSTPSPTPSGRKPPEGPPHPRGAGILRARPQALSRPRRGLRGGKAGGLAQVAVSAADEVAVEAFLQGKIPFPRIPEILARVLEATPIEPLTWESLFAVDAWAREEAKRWA